MEGQGRGVLRAQKARPAGLQAQLVSALGVQTASEHVLVQLQSQAESSDQECDPGWLLRL